MHKHIFLVLLGLCSLSLARAQMSGPPQASPDHHVDQIEDAIAREFGPIPISLDRRNSAAAEEQAYRNWLFHKKAKRFVDLWRRLMIQSNDARNFDPKLAQKVAKAFHDLEKSEGWPVKDVANR